jgi:hypothetical protein
VAGRIEGVSDHLAVLPRTQQAEYLYLGGAESAGQALDLAEEELAGALFAAAQALDAYDATINGTTSGAS